MRKFTGTWSITKEIFLSCKVSLVKIHPPTLKVPAFSERTRIFDDDDSDAENQNSVREIINKNYLVM